MSINLIQLYNISNDKYILKEKLQEWNLIPKEGQYECKKCNGKLTLSEDSSRPDGWRWMCLNKSSIRKQKARKCGRAVEFRSGTFFARTKLTIFQVLGFVHLWVGNASMKLITEQLEIEYQTAVNWASYCREMLFNSYITNKTKIGGVGKTVEIDESKYGKRKYHRGRTEEEQSVFGGYEMESGRMFMVTVEDRGAETLIPIIEDWIEPGTTIVSDFWRAYDCLDMDKYIKLKVNHSLHFRDPISMELTNSIGSSWSAAKAIKSSSGRKTTDISGNLARYMFDKRCNELNLNRCIEFFRIAGGMYNPCNPELELVADEFETDDHDI